jgi:hypothetical protein
MSRRTLLFAVSALLAGGCGAHHTSKPARHARHPAPPWTSSAEPSPPGSAGRWSAADEEQLREPER